MGGLHKKERAMFESTGEMIVVLVVFAVAVFPFVYLPLRGRRAKQAASVAGKTLHDNKDSDKD
jgi:hypothetical protein